MPLSHATMPVLMTRVLRSPSVTCADLVNLRNHHTTFSGHGIDTLGSQGNSEGAKLMASIFIKTASTKSCIWEEKAISRASCEPLDTCAVMSAYLPAWDIHCKFENFMSELLALVGHPEESRQVGFLLSGEVLNFSCLGRLHPEQCGVSCFENCCQVPREVQSPEQWEGRHSPGPCAVSARQDISDDS